tara:strand:- start:3196 stop:3426 length:231 start_codon:yes stop_codon:yes gene_type:complete
MTKQNDIQAALILLAKPGMSSKQLQKDIAKAFPKASKKDIRLAAFAAMIAIVDQLPEEAAQLQDLAISEALEPVAE